MTRTRVLAGIVTGAFCLTLAASVRADNAHGDINLEKLIFAQRHQLGVENDQGENEQGDDINYLYTGHFENNNGKHLGFTMALVHNGPRPEIVRPSDTSSTTQNPEPTAMVLLGTGLAAAAGFARRVNRRRR